MKKLIFISLVFIFSACSTSDSFKLHTSFQDVKVKTVDGQLIVENAQIKRVWQMTEMGLVTKSVTNLKTGKVWQNEVSDVLCDWSYYGLVDNATEGELVDLSAQLSTDEDFTSQHIEVVAEFFYPSSQTSIQYKIWAYPNTKGIRTQAFIKSGGVVQYADAKADSGNAARIELKAGKKYAPYSASEYTELWFATANVDDKAVELRAINLDPDKKYKVGISWWDYANGGGEQRVRITSVDGENDQTVIATTKVPDYKGKKEGAESFVVDVPEGVNMDGTVRIYIDNVKGKNATVAEVWVMEEGGKTDMNALEGEEVRLKELAESVPANYGLITYYNCGTDVAQNLMAISGYADYLPISGDGLARRYMGYYNDTQHRNTWKTPMYREVYMAAEEALKEKINWANILSVEDHQQGIMMVKESHKCVNQYGVDTGDFLWSKDGVKNTGTSLRASEIKADKYKWFWGSWTIVYDEGDAGRELALKQFDRTRFPVKQDRDMYSVMCTWGHSKTPRDGRNYATELEVLKELDYVAECGIDMLLIDDGWQVSLESKGANPDGGIGWKPYPANYPQNWKNVVTKAKEEEVRLGLWGVAQRMPADDMIWNYERLGMEQLKLDFASFGTHDKLNNMMDTVRRFMIETDHKCHISWDLTENAARYGYYWAREYGNLHFMNRKPFLPMNVLYVPSLALRDFWLLAKYNNLNKYQLVIQNPEVCDHASDAYLHSPGYCVATALMGIPEFMAVTRFYSPEARKEVRQLMDNYKVYQEDLFNNYVYPIGDEPSNSSWTGFQSCRPDKDFGYVMAFRELNNKEEEHKFALRFVQNKKVKFTNIQTGESFETQVGENGEFILSSKETADYQFLKYELL